MEPDFMEQITAEHRVRSAACLCTQMCKDHSDTLDAGLVQD